MLAWLSGMRNRGSVAQAAVLGIAPLLLLVLIGPAITYWGGTIALAAAALAASLCWTGAAVALVLCNLLRGSDQMLVALFVGMIARMSIPLGFGAMIHLLGGPLAQAGILYYVLIFYPVTLLVETALIIPKSSQPKPRQASLKDTP